jgi:hypothetical protein
MLIVALNVKMVHSQISQAVSCVSHVALISTVILTTPAVLGIALELVSLKTTKLLNMIWELYKGNSM